jgi:hypothetical protein
MYSKGSSIGDDEGKGPRAEGCEGERKMADPSAAEEPAAQLDFQNFGLSGENVVVDGRIGKSSGAFPCHNPSCPPRCTFNRA